MKNSEEIHFHNLLKAEIEKIALRKIALKRDFEYLPSACSHSPLQAKGRVWNGMN